MAYMGGFLTCYPVLVMLPTATDSEADIFVLEGTNVDGVNAKRTGALALAGLAWPSPLMSTRRPVDES